MAEPTALSFQAMGGPCRVVVDQDAEDVARAVRELVHLLERRWSRFLPTSEISALNRVADCVTVVSEPTYRLISYAARAREATGGRFNPLMLKQLEAHGYNRSWEDGPPVPMAKPVRPGSFEPIVLYPEANAVRLPAGTTFDPGGIGKGLAVDMAIELCKQRGSKVGCVELGGDLKVYGTPWYGSRWTIAVEDPFDPRGEIATFTPTLGAVTTSTTRKRSWVAGERRFHHILDPATGHPAETDIVSVTTCSEAAWWAEVAAKSALIAGSASATHALADLNTPGAIVTVDRRTIVYDGRTPAATGAR